MVDAAVGAPNEDIGSLADAGAVTIVRDIYSTTLEGGIALDQNSPGVPGAAEAGDRFGRSLDTVKVGGPAGWRSAYPVRTSARMPVPGRFSCSVPTEPLSPRGPA